MTINTKSAWLPGSTRGFRSRHHRIHSSGNYRNPPPAGEHAGLREYHQTRAVPKVILSKELKPRISDALIEHLHFDYRLKAVSVSSDHAHLLVELPDLPSAIKAVIGHAKRHASRVVRDVLPGVIWSAGCGYETVDDLDHFHTAEVYVLTKQGAGSWTWSPVDGGMWCEERNHLDR